MTTTTLITINAVLGAVVLYGLLHLLIDAVASGRHTTEAQLRELPQHERERIAA